MKLTTLIDLCGSLLVIAALAVLAGTFHVAGGLLVAGAGLIALSYVLTRGPGRRKRPETGGDT